MIENTVIDYLNRVLNVPAYMEEPTRKLDEYVVVKAIDNGRVNHIDAVTLNITSYSTTMEKAAQLNKTVKDAMYNIVSLDNISSSKCGGGGQAIETSSKRYAYECIFNLFYMED